MAYVKAVVVALVAAIVLGAGTGVVEALIGAGATVHPEDKATKYAMGFSLAANCAAFFVLLFVPLSVVLLFAARWWRSRRRLNE